MIIWVGVKGGTILEIVELEELRTNPKIKKVFYDQYESLPIEKAKEIGKLGDFIETMGVYQKTNQKIDFKINDYKGYIFTEYDSIEDFKKDNLELFL